MSLNLSASEACPSASRGPFVLVLLFVLLTPFSGARAFADGPVELLQAQAEIPEASLLDVGIQIFDPGLPDDEYERYRLEEKGVYADVRKAEARYIPLRLKQTLETTGFWGAVRLVPKTHVVDVRIAGAIHKSTGKDLEIDLLVVDSRGKKWIDKRYKREANPLAYHDKETIREPFQDLYNEIANDLVKTSRKLDEEDKLEVHRIAELRFANYLAPTPFADYLSVKKSKFKIKRLPSYEDPMMLRLGEIRERDFMFVDTLNEYYADFLARMDEPYDGWRAYSYEEQVQLDEIRRTARTQKILGIVAAIGGGVIATKSGTRGGRSAGELAMIGGIMAAKAGFEKAEEAAMQREALKELAASFDSEVAPILVDVEGEVLRLTGSVDTQYETWREILRQIFAAETGLPLDPNAAPLSATEGPSKN